MQIIDSRVTASQISLQVKVLFHQPGVSVNNRLSSCINDHPGSIRMDNGYCNQDYGLLGKYLFKQPLLY